MQSEDMVNIDFGMALEAMKQGKRVTRKGWNGKDMFLFRRPSDVLTRNTVIDKVKSLPQSVKDYYAKQKENGEGSNEIIFTAYICMKAADGTIVNGWLASQTDMLATDWVILD